MRELMKFFERSYSVVNSNNCDNNNQNNIQINNNNSNNNNNNNNNTNNNIHTNIDNNCERIDFSNNENDYRHKSLKKNRDLIISKRISVVDLFFYGRKAGKRQRWPKGVFLLMAGGIICIVTAIIMCIVQPYESIFKWKIVFGEGGEIFNLWEQPPVDLYLKIYLYNITNVEEFMNGQEKMKIEEVGPYVYNEILRHDQVVFNDNGTISTKPKHPIIWNQEQSGDRREDDILMLPNIALLSIAQVVAEKSYFVRLPVNLLIRQTDSQPIVNMTAREFLFGYETTLVTLGNQFLPDWISFDKVGLIDRMYDFTGDFATIYTGETDPRMSGLHDTYRGSKNLPQWHGEHCSNINGASDGSKFKSFLGENETLLFFRKSMCRAQKMVRIGEPIVINELLAHKYVFEENALDNGHIDERNKCFCNDNNCLPRGLLDVSNCYYGFPITISYPHFLDGDEKLLDHIIGNKPNRSEHETYFMINPISGLPLQVSVKFQINMAMRDVNNMAHVERFSNMVVPMLWLEITLLNLPKNLQERFKLYLNILPTLVDCLKWGTLICGIILLIFGITRTLIQISNTLSSQKFSKSKFKKQQTNFSHPTHSNANAYGEIEKLHDDDKHITIDDSILYDEQTDGKNYVLDEESAISDNEGNNNDGDDDNDDDGDDDNDDDDNDVDENKTGSSNEIENTSSFVNNIHLTNINEKSSLLNKIHKNDITVIKLNSEADATS